MPTPSCVARARVFGAVLLALASVVLVGCGGGGGGGGGNPGVAATQDLEVLRVRVVTPPPHLAAHELDVEVDLHAAEAAVDVGMIFFLSPKAAVDAGDPSPPHVVVDGVGFEFLPAGHHVREVRLRLAPDLAAAGAYYLFAVVDPHGAHPEADETDNGPSPEQIASRGALVTLATTHLNEADVVLESVSLSARRIEVDLTPTVHAPVGDFEESPNHDFDVTFTVSVTGSVPRDVRVAVLLELPAWFVINNHLFDPETQTWSQLGTLVRGVVPGQPRTFTVPGRLPEGALIQLRPDFGGATRSQPILKEAVLRCVVDPLNAIADHEPGAVRRDDSDRDEHRQDLGVVLALYDHDETEVWALSPAGGGAPAAAEVSWAVPFVHRFADDKIGVGVSFQADAAIDLKGVRAHARASVPVTLFGKSADLLSLEATGRYNPVDESATGFVVTLKALNKTLYERRTVQDETLAPAPFLFQREYRVSTTIFAGPVPLLVTVGASGEVGLDVSATAGLGFAATVGPHVEFSAFVEGGIGGGAAGCTLAAGFGVEIPLIRDRFHADFSGAFAWSPGTRTLTGTFAAAVANDLEGPSGRLYAFAEGTCGWGWTSFSKRFETTLATWSSFARRDTLFQRSTSVSVGFP